MIVYEIRGHTNSVLVLLSYQGDFPVPILDMYM